MEGSSHTMTTEPLPGDSITKESINRLRCLKYELFCIETDTTYEIDKIMERNNIHIPRVPLWMREYKASSECFDPAVVSIGPYHHGKPKLARIEELKIISARRFVTDCKSSMCDIYSKLESLTSEAKKYYNDSIIANFDDEAFTVMMLLDGCFILEFIQQVVYGSGWNMFMTLGNDIPLISRDLFLLENQLPFLILKELMKQLSDSGSDLMVHNYINSEISKTYGMSSSPSTGPRHILDLFRTKLVGYKPIFHSLSRQERCERSKRSYPPVKELLAMGMTFKKRNSICLCDVEFQTHLLSGELLLPQIEINHYTKDRFLNLIAYELNCGVPKKHAFIAFICFLDSLIENADDVKVLCSEGIICNYLGSDEEVANLVDQLATGLIPDPFAYLKVVREIQLHLQKKRMVYIAKLKHTYFRSPWSAISSIAGGIIILLTSFQTYFTVFPR